MNQRPNIDYTKPRLDLDETELYILKDLISSIDINNYRGREDRLKSLIDKINNPKRIKHSFAKIDAAEIATEARTAKAKAKIKETHEQLKRDLMRGNIKKISYYAISKKSGVHINTVKKYITLDEVKG